MGGRGPALPGGVCPPLPRGSDPGGWRPPLPWPSLALLCACAQLLCLPFVEWGARGGVGKKLSWRFIGRALDASPAPAGVRFRVLRAAKRQPSRVLLSS